MKNTIDDANIAAAKPATMPVDDGGPAFPYTHRVKDETHIYHGMSLRDYFAGQALAGILGKMAFNQEAEDMLLANGIKTEQFEAFAAQIAYDSADAMIAARKGGAS